jgi:NAD(P)-dependent dehydrogenase (short-subunit alcohol dehydrogenase family)
MVLALRKVRVVNLNNCRVLVTGGLGVLGSAIVTKIENAGGLAIATSRNLEKVEAFNIQSKKKNSTAVAAQLEFNDEQQCRISLENIVQEYGPITGLFNNAYAVETFKNVEETRWEDWTKAMTVNVAAANSLAVILANKGDLNTVVNIASMYAIRAPEFPMYPEGMEPNSLIYGPSKAALLSLTRYLAAYWGERGIRVNAVSPGGIINNQNKDFLQHYNATVPMQRMVSPDEVASTVCFLLSSDAGGITGENIIVDAGRTIW